MVLQMYKVSKDLDNYFDGEKIVKVGKTPVTTDCKTR